MTLIEWAGVLGTLFALIAAIAAIITVIQWYLERRDRRPKLRVSWADQPIVYEENASGKHKARLRFLIINEGRAVAHDVRGDFYPEDTDANFEPVDNTYWVSLSEANPVPPGRKATEKYVTAYRHEVNAQIFELNKSIKVHYKIMCSEAVPPAQGTLPPLQPDQHLSV